jgi:hypothetical protein
LAGGSAEREGEQAEPSSASASSARRAVNGQSTMTRRIMGRWSPLVYVTFGVNPSRFGLQAGQPAFGDRAGLQQARHTRDDLDLFGPRQVKHHAHAMAASKAPARKGHNCAIARTAGLLGQVAAEVDTHPSGAVVADDPTSCLEHRDGQRHPMPQPTSRMRCSRAVTPSVPARREPPSGAALAGVPVGNQVVLVHAWRIVAEGRRSGTRLHGTRSAGDALLRHARRGVRRLLTFGEKRLERLLQRPQQSSAAARQRAHRRPPGGCCNRA